MAVLVLQEAKQYLKITGDDQNGTLQEIIDAAQAAIENRVGPLEQGAQTTLRLRGDGGILVLPTTNAELVSVTPVGGTALDLTLLNFQYGIISPYYGWLWSSWMWFDVVYVSGRSVCPDDLKLALLELVRHLWSPQRGGGQRPNAQADTAANTLPGAAYLFPFRVEQLLEPYTLPGIG